jgi:hypothetical protein
LSPWSKTCPPRAAHMPFLSPAVFVLPALSLRPLPEPLLPLPSPLAEPRPLPEPLLDILRSSINSSCSGLLQLRLSCRSTPRTHSTDSTAPQEHSCSLNSNTRPSIDQSNEAQFASVLDSPSELPVSHYVSKQKLANTCSSLFYNSQTYYLDCTLANCEQKD